MLKTSGYTLGFQHSPRDLANVNEWKIMFDPYIEIKYVLYKCIFQRKNICKKYFPYEQSKKKQPVFRMSDLVPQVTEDTSCVMRKPDFRLCESKGSDQLCSNCTVDPHLCFCYMDSTISPLLKSEISSF